MKGGEKRALPIEEESGADGFALRGHSGLGVESHRFYVVMQGSLRRFTENLKRRKPVKFSERVAEFNRTKIGKSRSDEVKQ